jgi:aminoglycoside phosphotransferase (APT) family kinase protein
VAGDRLRAVLPLSTGHSNETYLLDGLELVLRMPPAGEGLLPPYDVARQFRIMTAIASVPGGPPVPRLVELCEDAEVLGDPFFLMERLPGEAFETNELPDWFLDADPETRETMCGQWVDAVAAVHTMPASTYGEPARSAVAEATYWLELAANSGNDEVANLLEALIREPLPSSGPPAPEHGDAKNANCLWHDRRLMALLDWELCGVGEPLWDLGYMMFFFQPGIEQVPGWWHRERVIARWEEQTGRSARGLERYEALAAAKIAAILSRGVYVYKAGILRDPRFLFWEMALPQIVGMTRAAADRI